jgi:hypothetical protein
MGNKGAFININGKDMKPQFQTYTAVVSIRQIFHKKLKNLTQKISFTAPSQRQTNGLFKFPHGHADVVLENKKINF